MTRIAMLATTMILLAACATAGPATDGCEWTAPILVSQSDDLTDGTARQILAHNRTGERVCGW